MKCDSVHVSVVCSWFDKKKIRRILRNSAKKVSLF